MRDRTLYYNKEDVIKSHRWLGHKGFTELNAYHPDYKHGKENYEWNLRNRTFTKIYYARDERALLIFVHRYYKERTLCYGLNPRPKIFRHKTGKGYPRSARENEIEVSQNLLLDFDLEGKTNKERVADFDLFLEKAEEYFQDKGIKPPVRAFTGRGYHLLFAYPEVKVREYPDIAEKLKEFTNQFRSAYRQDLDRLEVKLDNTQDLRRMVRIYGTAKPRVGIVSRFYGGERVEDEKLREYLLQIKIPEPSLGNLGLKPGAELPQWFISLLERDQALKGLWSGEGKPEDYDTTRSGYDYSLVRRLLNMGYKNIDELATILALRPTGAVKKSGKGEGYIKRTIANALVR